MTESQKTNAFLKKLRLLVPDAVIFKHNDRITAGIPDASMTRKGRTIWVEFKDGTKIPDHQRKVAEMMGNVWFYDHKTKILQRPDGMPFKGEEVALRFIQWELI